MYDSTLQVCRLNYESRAYASAIQAFKIRAAEIADHAHNSGGALGEGAEFLRGLDETERQRMFTIPG